MVKYKVVMDCTEWETAEDNDRKLQNEIKTTSTNDEVILHMIGALAAIGVAVAGGIGIIYLFKKGKK